MTRSFSIVSISKLHIPEVTRRHQGSPTTYGATQRNLQPDSRSSKHTEEHRPDNPPPLCQTRRTCRSYKQPWPIPQIVAHTSLRNEGTPKGAHDNTPCTMFFSPIHKVSLNQIYAASSPAQPFVANRLKFAITRTQ